MNLRVGSMWEINEKSSGKFHLTFSALIKYLGMGSPQREDYSTNW